MMEAAADDPLTSLESTDFSLGLSESSLRILGVRLIFLVSTPPSLRKESVFVLPDRLSSRSGDPCSATKSVTISATAFDRPNGPCCDSIESASCEWACVPFV